MREILLETTGLSPFATAILRNFNMVSVAVLAKTFECKEKEILETASSLGLKERPFNDKWLKQGYLTIIRNNWHLLPYEQILSLLSWNMEKLQYTLKEEDFFEVKLGKKTDCEKVVYNTPTITEQIKFDSVKKVTDSLNLKSERNFEFFLENETKETQDKKVKQSGIRMVSSYSGSCGDSLMSETLPFSEKLLIKLSKLNVNAVWLPAILYELAPYPFDEKFSIGYKTRLKNLNRLIKLTGQYGIKVFLYLNEPRCQNDEFFKNGHEYLRGAEFRGKYALCTSKQEVKDYIVSATAYLMNSAKDLGGIITITESENLTNCYSRATNTTNCPNCASRNKVDVVVEVNNLIKKGIDLANSSAKLIAWNWGQNPDHEFTIEDNIAFIDKLQKDILFMSVSEDALKYEIDGKEQWLNDYSISQVGASEKSAKLWKHANAVGIETVAKIQINNSWELSSTPFIPVFPTYIKHLKRIHELKVKNYMLTWTLGSYPGGAMSLASYDYNESEEEILKKFLITEYGEKNLVELTKAVNLFSESFSNFPFCLSTLYVGAQNCSVANPFYPKKTDMNSTMIGYPFDDLKNWIYPHKLETYLEKLKKLLKIWEQGLEEIEKIEINEKTKLLIDASKVCYISYKSLYNQCAYYVIRDNLLPEKTEQRAIIASEENLTKEMLEIISDNPYIGFEASNHYLFSQNNLLEKLINLNNLKQQN